MQPQGTLIVGLLGVERIGGVKTALYHCEYSRISEVSEEKIQHGESRRIDAFQARVPREYYSV